MEFEIAETVRAAEIYLEKLKPLENDIHNAEQQILSTYKVTKDEIRKTFSNLKKQLCDILEKREKFLLNKTEEIKTQGLLPIKQCATVIKNHINSTKLIIKQGNQSTKLNCDQITELHEKGSLIGNLPELPDLKDVPYLSFYHEPVHDLENICLNLGEVFRIAPVQINEVIPKPGALLIEWQQVIDNDEEKVRDIKEFRLQRTFGNALKSENGCINFIDCYKGPDTQYLHRDINVNQIYSFRVCCKFEGSNHWSPWSVPQLGCTIFKCFSWKKENGLNLSNDNKIVEFSSNCVQYDNIIAVSDGAQVRLGDSIEITIIETDQYGEIVLALLDEEPCRYQSLLNYTKSIFSICSSGKIFVDGIEKATVMPKFLRGTKVCFSSEQLTNDRIRVHIDSNEKRVTYDWNINDCTKLFFACQITKSSITKIMVE